MEHDSNMWILVMPVGRVKTKQPKRSRRYYRRVMDPRLSFELASGQRLNYTVNAKRSADRLFKGMPCSPALRVGLTLGVNMPCGHAFQRGIHSILAAANRRQTEKCLKFKQDHTGLKLRKIGISG